MPSVWPDLERVLPLVETPSQYIGGEVNAIVKAHESVKVKLALAFPDVYKIGMSHAGFQIFYGQVNRRPDALAERCFAPWPDLRDKMRARRIPLFTLETHTPVREFDLIGFSLQYEMCYTTLLEMLHLAGIPLHTSERRLEDPIIVAGGPCAFCPEPIADFIDLFVVGDGEEVIEKLLDATIVVRGRNGEAGPQPATRKDLLREMVRCVPAVYAPSFYEPVWKPDGTLEAIRPTEEGIPAVVRKATVKDLNTAYHPTAPVIPFSETVHDRVGVEIMRGCPHVCRFCQSWTIKSPVRHRSAENVLAAAEETYKNTGHPEITLTSLSSGDYRYIEDVMGRLTGSMKRKKVSVSLPSLRINEKTQRLPSTMNAVRKSGITLAPEAGSTRLRQVVKKTIKNADLFSAARMAYEQGWTTLKLYFMVGLPSETDQDIRDLIDLCFEVSNLRKEYGKGPGTINVTISPYVPKAQTPFQWDGMMSPERHAQIRAMFEPHRRNRNVHFKVHDAERSMVEGLMSRADRRVGKAVEEAWRRGAYLDPWDEFYNHGLWLQVLKDTGVDPDFYAHRTIPIEEFLPWDHIDSGIKRKLLVSERAKAFAIEKDAEDGTRGVCL